MIRNIRIKRTYTNSLACQSDSQSVGKRASTTTSAQAFHLKPNLQNLNAWYFNTWPQTGRLEAGTLHNPDLHPQPLTVKLCRTIVSPPP